jgi:hypothetical protein
LRSGAGAGIGTEMSMPCVTRSSKTPSGSTGKLAVGDLPVGGCAIIDF